MDERKKTNCLDRRRDYRQQVSNTTIKVIRSVDYVEAEVSKFAHAEGKADIILIEPYSAPAVSYPMSVTVVSCREIDVWYDVFEQDRCIV